VDHNDDTDWISCCSTMELDDDFWDSLLSFGTDEASHFKYGYVD